MRLNYFLQILLGVSLFCFHWTAIAQSSLQTELALYQKALYESDISQSEFNYHLERLQIKSSKTLLNTAKSGTSSLSGNVYHSNSPLANQTIFLYSTSTGYVDMTHTDATGYYEFTALAADAYYIKASNPSDDYIDAIWTTAGTTYFQGAEPPTQAVITLTVGQHSAGHNLHLNLGAKLTGTLVDAVNAQQVNNLSVEIYPTNSSYYGWYYETQLNGQGQYTLSGVIPGTYRVYLSRSYFGSNPYIPEVYNNIHCNVCFYSAAEGLGDVVQLNQGATTSGINFSLDLGASISGRLLNNDGVVPLEVDGKVAIFDSNGDLLTQEIIIGTSSDPSATGDYSVGGLLPGSYFVQASDLGNAFFIREMYDNIDCPYSGCQRAIGSTPINLGPAEQRKNTHFLLDYGGKISGKVTDFLTGLPINQYRQFVQFYDSNGLVAGGAEVNPMTGEYISSRALRPGVYTARTGSMFSGDFTSGYIMQKYDPLGNLDCPGITCDLNSGNITVNAYNPHSGSPDPIADATTTGIDFALETGLSFSGTITDLNQGLPLQDVHVLVYNHTGQFANWATTDTHGDFTVSGLPAGTYYAKTNNGSSLPFIGVGTKPTGNWVDILYNNLHCPGSTCDVTTGTPIILGASPNADLKGATQYNFDLPHGGTLSGRLLHSETTVGLNATEVKVYNNNAEFMGAYITDAQGYWQTSGMPADSYYLITQGHQGMVDVKFGGDYCFEGLCDPLSADPIVLSGQYNITNLNMILKPDYIFRSGMD